MVSKLYNILIFLLAAMSILLVVLLFRRFNVSLWYLTIFFSFAVYNHKEEQPQHSKDKEKAHKPKK